MADPASWPWYRGIPGPLIASCARHPYIADVPRKPFIGPSTPVLRSAPPSGPEWLHEVKYDGWRAQMHISGGIATIYGKNGGDLTRRFRSITAAVERLPVTSAIIDAELVACNADGAPNFYAMMRGAPHGCCVYCFDLLEFEGRALVATPLDERRQMLRRLLRRADKDVLRLSEVFDDPATLLAACEIRGLEGIVSKRRKIRTAPDRRAGGSR